MPNFLILNEKDNVAVALEPAKAGDAVTLSGGRTIKANQDIPFAHKIAIQPLKAGEKVLKYGEVIGAAKENIKEGDHVHVHNIRSLRGETGKK